MSTPDDTSPAEMVVEHRCPVCDERATLHCAGCGRVFCADHVVRGFALGYAFVCAECAAQDDAAE
jgi:hypothetical protein